MNLRRGALSVLFGVAGVAAMSEADITTQCRCTCMMRPTLPEVICEIESLQTLCKAVSAYPALVETLSREDLKYTVFAPNDDAWGNLMLIHDDLLGDEEKLTNLLLLHVIVGFEPICYEDLVCSNIMYMANGQNSKTACSFTDGPPQGDDATGEPGEEPTAIFQKGRGNNNSKGNMPEIVGPDTRSKNGVIHIINNVILQKDSLGPDSSSSSSSSSSDSSDSEDDECSGGKSCGECKGECQDNDGCRFSKVGWCKRDCEERFPDGCQGGDDSASEICFGGFDCASCQKECADNEGCERESTEECQTYCEEKWGGCQCTGGTSCGSCKGECQNNDGCRFSKVGYCKRDCEERFPGGCEGGDDSASEICFGGTSCGTCKRECQDNEGCGRESTGQCKGYCQEKWGAC